jgi:putative ABC transport system ATP-binding protein
MQPHIKLVDVEKAYGATVKTLALQATSLEIGRGEVVGILGPSGSGKTTLLNLIGGMDSPDKGSLNVGGQELAGLSDRALGEYRRTQVGFVFQFFNLVPSLTAWENVALAAELTGQTAGVSGLLSAVGLSGLEDRFPAELSGGQQQRVAIARALAKKPALLLCDEPTGALDQATGAQILSLLLETAASQQTTTLIVTHDPAIAARAHRTLVLQDGKVISC